MLRIQLIVAILSVGCFKYNLSFYFLSIFCPKLTPNQLAAAFSFKWGFKDLFLGKNESPNTTVAKMELRYNNNNNNSSHNPLNYCFSRGEKYNCQEAK